MQLDEKIDSLVIHASEDPRFQTEEPINMPPQPCLLFLARHSVGESISIKKLVSNFSEGHSQEIEEGLKGMEKIGFVRVVNDELFLTRSGKNFVDQLVARGQIGKKVVGD